MEKLRYAMAIFICLIMAMSVFGVECVSAAKNTKKDKKGFSGEVDFIGKAKIKGKVTEVRDAKPEEIAESCSTGDCSTSSCGDGGCSGC